MLQAHYRSVLDLSSDALEAAEKGYNRLINGIKLLSQLPQSNESSVDITKSIQAFYDAMNDDFNSPVLIAELFETVKLIHRVSEGEDKLTASDIETLQKTIDAFVFDVLGLTLDASSKEDNAFWTKR